jgi:pyruvate,water dikinase
VTYTKTFEQLGKNDANIAGGKGASLGEMTSAGIPVPKGFVVLSNSFDSFILDSDISEKIAELLTAVDYSSNDSATQASVAIQKMILSASIPDAIRLETEKQFTALNCKHVAVRSSATAEDSIDAAWAGQLDSFLFITQGTLIEHVKKCWASLYTPRAIFYRNEKKLLNTHISVAVVVQQMIDSQVSGVGFSVHPVTEDKDHLIIEAVFGQGEALVSGQVTPDAYIVSKKDFSIVEIDLNEQERGLFHSDGSVTWKSISDFAKQKLPLELIRKLAREIVRIENHYGFACDIEWCVVENDVFIVQSRPITTLS